MTELELLLMRVAGLSELETKDLLKLLSSLESFDRDHLSKLKLLLMETGLLEMDANNSVELLVKLRSSHEPSIL